MSETTAAIPAPTKKSKKNLMIIGAGAVVLIAIAGGAGFWWSQRAQAQTQTQGDTEEASKDSPKDKAKSKKKKKDIDNDSSGVVSFEPFVVNLADTGGSRFLRVKVQLIVEEKEQAESIEKTPVKLSRARAAILELLTTQTADVLVTPEGKAELRKSIAEHVGETIDVEVIDVLFSDFVVQF